MKSNDFLFCVYSNYESLSNHKRLIHGNPKLHPCTHCEYKAKSKEHCEMHIKSIHEKIKEKCTVCGKQFSNSHNLNRHRKKNHLNSSYIENMN